MTRTLVVLRHAKSDWHTPAGDLDRPLNERGRRQAPEAGRWLARHGPAFDLAVVSVAQRARSTWELVAAELPAAPPVRLDEAVYTFDGDALAAVVGALGDERAVLLVGHNPAVQQLVATRTGVFVEMTTSALAVIELEDWAATGRLVTAGRPPPTP